MTITQQYQQSSRSGDPSTSTCISHWGGRLGIDVIAIHKLANLGANLFSELLFFSHILRDKWYLTSIPPDRTYHILLEAFVDGCMGPDTCVPTHKYHDWIIDLKPAALPSCGTKGNLQKIQIHWLNVCFVVSCCSITLPQSGKWILEHIGTWHTSCNSASWNKGHVPSMFEFVTVNL